MSYKRCVLRDGVLLELDVLLEVGALLEVCPTQIGCLACVLLEVCPESDYVSTRRVS